MNIRHLLPLCSLVLMPGALPAAEPEDAATSGTLQAILGRNRVRELPLVHTDVRVEISAFVARTTVEQVFRNDLDEPIEAVYTFPLGDESAVDDFELRTANQVVRGEVHRREQARQKYEKARSEGFQAALLEQHRSNVFVQSLANLMPAGEIRVRLRTVELLHYDRGTYEYVFPMTVAPPYGPEASPDERSGHDIDVHVEIDAGVPVDNVVSPVQTIYVRRVSPSRVEVDLAEVSRIPNRDFILRWDVSAEEPILGLLSHRQNDAGFFTLLLQPKGSIDMAEAGPKEVVLVMDTSGSMSGAPVELAKRFASDVLATLGPRDRFNVIQFSSGSSRFSPRSVDGTRAEVQRALDWIHQFEGDGGTEMLKGLSTVLETESEPGAFSEVVFLTDGFIGNDDEVVRAVASCPPQYRIFTVGIGDGVNHALLRRMANAGRGAYTFIPAQGDAQKALERLHGWLTLPYFTDIEIDWGGLPIGDLAPAEPRDLFSGQTLRVVGRYWAAAEGTIRVRGYLGGVPWEREIPVTLPEIEPAHAALASIWARHRIEELLRPKGLATTEEVREEVTDLALTYRLMSPFTSFVAVDDSVRVNESPVVESVETATLPLPDELVAEQVLVTVFSNAFVDGRTVTSDLALSAQFIQNLPIAGRFYSNALTLAPGVQDADGDGSPNVHGSRDRDFRAVISGVPALNPMSAQLMAAMDNSSIEEVQLISAGAGVEFSRAQGGFANIVQRQGSNALDAKVDLVYRLHEAELDAMGHGAEASFEVSGPVVKDRLWFRLAHGGFGHDVPVDTTKSVEVVPTRASVHADRLTWQVSARNKLALEVSSDSLDLRNVGIGSWTAADATGRVRNSGSRYLLEWTTPVSPQLLVGTALAYQTWRHDLGANQEHAPHRCGEGLDPELRFAQCLDLFTHTTSGAAYRLLDQDRRRLSLASKATLFAGRFAGASHTVTVGATIDDETYERELTRGPSLVRSSNGEELTARLALDPRSDADSRSVSWALFAEDRLEPTSSVTLTLGLRVDRTDIEATGRTLPVPRLPPAPRRPESLVLSDSALSPSVGISWDPWGDGRARLWLSGRRYHGELHPALGLIDVEPATYDVDARTYRAGDPTDFERPNVQYVSRTLELPHHDEWSVGFEREIFPETKLGLSYVDVHYDRQLGYADRNALPDGSGRIHPDWGELLEIGNLTWMNYRAATLELIRRQYRSWEMQASYTWSVADGSAHELDLFQGDERSRIEIRPGYQATDQRHAFRAAATTITPWGLRFGGALRWDSGLPYSEFESTTFRASPLQSAVPTNRLVYTSGRRNDLRNASVWAVDAKLVKELGLGRPGALRVSIEVFDLFDRETYLVYNEARGLGLRIDGADDAVRRTGRYAQLGLGFVF